MNSTESPIRRLIFELFIEHGRKGKVARILNDLGYTTRQRKSWSDVAVSRLLECSSAIGVYAVNKTQRDKDGKRVPRPESEWEYIECEAIVSKKLWNQVHAILGGSKKADKKVSRAPVHTFTGVIACSRCDKKLVVPKKSSRKYRCPTKKCGTSIAIVDLEAVFQDELAEFLTNRKSKLDQILSDGPNVLDKKQRLEELLGELKSIRRKISKSEELFLNEEISLERFGEMHSKLESELKDSGIIRDELKKEIDLAISVPESPDPPSISELVENWINLPVSSRQKIVHALVDSIKIGNGEIELTYKFQQTPPNKPRETELSLKEGQNSQQTKSPTNAPEIVPGEPIYIRVPKTGKVCPYTSLSRSKMYDLIVGNPRNGFKPPVKSINLTMKGRQRGTRLIVWSSLKSYLANQIDD